MPFESSDFYEFLAAFNLHKWRLLALVFTVMGAIISVLAMNTRYYVATKERYQILEQSQENYKQLEINNEVNKDLHTGRKSYCYIDITPSNGGLGSKLNANLLNRGESDIIDPIIMIKDLDYNKVVEINIGRVAYGRPYPIEIPFKLKSKKRQFEVWFYSRGKSWFQKIIFLKVGKVWKFASVAKDQNNKILQPVRTMHKSPEDFDFGEFLLNTH